MMADNHEGPAKFRPIQYLAILALALLYGGNLFDVYVNPPEPWAYWALAAIALGVDAVQLRTLLLKFLETWAGKK